MGELSRYERNYRYYHCAYVISSTPTQLCCVLKRKYKQSPHRTRKLTEKILEIRLISPIIRHSDEAHEKFLTMTAIPEEKNSSQLKPSQKIFKISRF